MPTIPRTYLPFLHQSTPLKMGLRPLPVADWIQPDDRFDLEIVLKRQLLATRPDEVLLCLPDSESAQQELRALLWQELPRHHPTYYQQADESLHTSSNATLFTLDDAPLRQASLWVQDDLCLLQQRGGHYCLTAASLCAPSHWSLREKIGQPLPMLHVDVPGYASHLAVGVNRVFDRLVPNQLLWRSNWSLARDTVLFHPDEPELPDFDADTAGNLVFLRVERQTLRRLPESGAIVFTIRVYVDPLAAWASQPEVMAALAQAIENLSPAQLDYKGIEDTAPTLLAYLRRFIPAR